MKKTIGIDALAIRYSLTKENKLIKEIKKNNPLNTIIECGKDFYLKKIIGSYFSDIYEIYIFNIEEELLFGELRFGFNNIKDNKSFWIYVNNRSLYDSYNILFERLSLISTKLNLKANNITTIDICLDSSIDIAKWIKKNIRDKDTTTILNGKSILNREDDRPEITYTMSGDMNKFKYLTVTVKQKNALLDKTKGITIIAYDKKSEIKNASHKDYINDYYNNPSKLFRLEVHLNSKEINNYIENEVKIFKENKEAYYTEEKDIIHYLIYNRFRDIEFLYKVFLDALNRVIRFNKKGENKNWNSLFSA